MLRQFKVVAHVIPPFSQVRRIHGDKDSLVACLLCSTDQRQRELSVFVNVELQPHDPSSCCCCHCCHHFFYCGGCPGAEHHPCSHCSACWKYVSKQLIKIKFKVEILTSNKGDFFCNPRIFFQMHCRKHKRLAFFFFFFLSRTPFVPLAVAVSPSGWAILCMAVAATQMGMLRFSPSTRTDRSTADTFLNIRGMRYHLCKQIYANTYVHSREFFIPTNYIIKF